jgi:serine/threonine protein kinase
MYFNQILEGVKYFHSKGNYHRDLKPENILIDKKQKRAVIADFGISHFNEEHIYTVVETKINSKLANFQYAAPEQRERGSAINHKADIYALGLILNEMFTGKVPYGTGYKKISSVSDDYSFLDDVVDEMLRQNQLDRIDNIEKIQFEINSRIAIHNQNKELQKIKSIEITQGEERDELIVDPPKLVDFKYDDVGQMLTLILSKDVNEKWQSCMTKSSYNTIGSYDPDIFRFNGNVFSVKLRYVSDISIIQNIIDYFKSWVENANRHYPILINAEKENSIREQSVRLAQEIERKSKVISALEKIKI